MSIVTMDEVGIDEWAVAHEESSDTEAFTGRHPLPEGFHVTSVASNAHTDEVCSDEYAAMDAALADMVGGNVDQPGLNSRDRRTAARSLQRRAAQAVADRFAADAEGLSQTERLQLAEEYRQRIRSAGQGELLEVSNLRNVLNADLSAVIEDELLARVVHVLRTHPEKPKRRRSRGRRGGRGRNKATNTNTSQTTDTPKARKVSNGKPARRGNPNAGRRRRPSSKS